MHVQELTEILNNDPEGQYVPSFLSPLPYSRLLMSPIKRLVHTSTVLVFMAATPKLGTPLNYLALITSRAYM